MWMYVCGRNDMALSSISVLFSDQFSVSGIKLREDEHAIRDRKRADYDADLPS
jgi:hypothetical protein